MSILTGPWRLTLIVILGLAFFFTIEGLLVAKRLFECLVSEIFAVLIVTRPRSDNLLSAHLRILTSLRRFCARAETLLPRCKAHIFARFSSLLLRLCLSVIGPRPYFLIRFRVVLVLLVVKTFDCGAEKLKTLRFCLGAEAARLLLVVAWADIPSLLFIIALQEII